MPHGATIHVRLFCPGPMKIHAAAAVAQRNASGEHAHAPLQLAMQAGATAAHCDGPRGLQWDSRLSGSHSKHYNDFMPPCPAC